MFQVAHAFWKQGLFSFWGMCVSFTWLWKHPYAYSSDSGNHPVEIPYLIHSVSHWTGSHYVAQV